MTQVYGKMDKDPDGQEDRIFHTFQGLRMLILGNIHNWPVMYTLPALQENNSQLRAFIGKTTTIYTILISQETVVASGYVFIYVTGSRRSIAWRGRALHNKGAKKLYVRNINSDTRSTQ